MNLYGKILGCFYAIVLSLWSVAVPLADYHWQSELSVVLETTDEKVHSFDQADVYFLAGQNNNFWGIFRTDFPSHLDHYFNNYIFQHLYLKNFYATAISLFESVDVKFEFIDLIFPFHYFW
jgi:hypothetical protein